MPHLKFEITASQNILEFSTRPDGPASRPWWRELDLKGIPLYRIGNICDTCEVMFEKLHSADLPIEPTVISERFRQGLDGISEEIKDTIAFILPKGSYVASLLWIQPEQAGSVSGSGNQPEDFHWISRYQAKLPQKMENKEKVKILEWFKNFKLGPSSDLSEDILHEMVLPFVDEKLLDQSSIQRYQDSISRGLVPTALALSVADVRYPGGRSLDVKLVHFLLDGHHKMMAASNLKKPITMLSFLNVSESFAPADWVSNIVRSRY